MAPIQDQLELTSTDATAVSVPIAGTGSRSYAFIIDWHIRLVLALAWFIASAALLGLLGDSDLLDGLSESSGTFVFYMVILPPVLIYFLYHPLIEVIAKGRTPGKRAAGIRVVTVDGHTPDAAALLIRNVFRLIDALPLFYVLGLTCVLLTPRQVRIGDMAAGTLLAYEKKLRGDAFERFASHEDSTVGLPAVEVAQDLLRRWETLAPDKRSRIAAKLIASQGENVPDDMPKRAFDREMHRRVIRLAHAPRG